MTQTETTADLSAGEMVRRTCWYSVANLGHGMFYALNNAVLPLFLKNMGASGVLIGLMSNSHSAEGAVIQPVVGAMSDRLRTPLGRRRPFLLLFTPVCALFLLLTPCASRLRGNMRALPGGLLWGVPLSLIVVVVCIFLFTVTFNIASDPYQSLMPDIIPARQRGRTRAFWSFLGVLGQATLVMLPPEWVPLPSKFVLVAIIMLLTTLLTCWQVHEPHYRQPGWSEVAATQLESEQSVTNTHSEVKRGHDSQIRGAGDTFRQIRQIFGQMQIAWEGLKTLRQARKLLIATFFVGTGVGAIFPFLTVFATTITHCTDHAAEMLFLVLMLSTAATVLPFGWLCDRVGAKFVLLIAFLLITLVSLIGIGVNSYALMVPVMVLAGLGNAAQSASAYPLLTQLVPEEEVGFYTGVQSTVESIAAPVTAALTGSLVDHGGYRWIFVVCSVSVGIALAILAQVRGNMAANEIDSRKFAP